MRLKAVIIGPTTYKTFRKEFLVLILGQPPRQREEHTSHANRTRKDSCESSASATALLSQSGPSYRCCTAVAEPLPRPALHGPGQ